MYVLQAFRIAVRVHQIPPPVNVGTDGVFYLHVRNLVPWSGRAHLKVAGQPAGWPAATSYPMVNLDGRETAPVPLVVRVPVTAAAGRDVAFKIRVRPNKWTPWLLSRTLHIHTVDVVVERPVSVMAPAAAPVPLAA